MKSRGDYTSLSQTPNKHQPVDPHLARTIALRTLCTILATAGIIAGGYMASRKTALGTAAMTGPQQVDTPSNPWEASATMLSDNVQRVEIIETGSGLPLSFAAVFALLASNPAFATFFTSTLAASPWPAFFWECKAVTIARLETVPYEHVVVRAPRFAPADPTAFAEHFSKCGDTSGAAHFASLGGDAMLVAPCERGERSHYSDIAAFVRGAAPAQHAQLWQTVGRAFKRTLNARGDALTWVSTEGSGVPWLHIRLDSAPKYYHHQPYANPKATGGGARSVTG